MIGMWFLLCKVHLHAIPFFLLNSNFEVVKITDSLFEAIDLIEGAFDKMFEGLVS